MERLNYKALQVTMALLVCLLIAGTTTSDRSALAALPEASGAGQSQLQAMQTAGQPGQPDAPVGSGFTYQGSLKNGGSPANGQYDFQFTLYDALTGGNVVGTLVTTANVTVTGGLFSVTLDFGVDAFTGEARYLQIAVRQTGGGTYTTLTPRQALTPTPYALSLKPGAVIRGTTGPGVAILGTVNSGSGYGMYGESTGSNGTGLRGVANTGPNAAGVYGSSSSSYGVWGESTASNGSGLRGVANNDFDARGVYGSSDSGTGVYGSSIDGFGIYGSSTNHLGVEGISINDIGVYGQSAYFHAVYGESANSGDGVHGVSLNNGRGVYGRSTSGIGVEGYSTTNEGVRGVTDSSNLPGVYGYNGSQSGTGPGVRGDSYAGPGVYGYSPGNRGVWGVSSNGDGVYGTSTTLSGVAGFSTSGYGVYGSSSTNPGVRGDGNTGPGVYGFSAGNKGVWGVSTTNDGVHGGSNSSSGVAGISYSGNGVYGTSTIGWAGYFDGNVNITGSCCAAAEGTYRIDHPQDPANKYLNQSAVESPDMKTIYDGMATLDATGEAWVSMPSYSQSLNQDFRYQLTPIGAPGRDLYIAQEIQNNRFKIAGGNAGMKVSWQVTGIRHDPYAVQNPVTVEQDKPANEKGKYLHPKELGQPESLGIGYEQSQRAKQQLPPPPAKPGR